MKVLLVGAGGVGGWLIPMLNHGFYSNQIDPEIEITVADYDCVSLKNVMYSNYTEEEVTKNKAKAICKRYDFLIPWECKVTKKDLFGYDMIIMCVDSNQTRKEIFEHCKEHKKYFLDIRAEGRLVSVFGAEENNFLSTFDIGDITPGSCQLQTDIENNKVEYGNRVSAAIGMQCFINHIRGTKNKRHIMFL